VVVYLGVGEITLFLALGDQLFQAGLLFHDIGHSADTFTKNTKKN
jgi:hypothetical protein